MRPLDPLASLLETLLEHGSVPGARIGPRMQERLRSLFDCEVLGWQRSGAGRRLILRDPKALERFALAHYPSGLGGLDALGIPPVAAAVANFRDAHRGKGEREVVNLRGFRHAHIESDSGKRLDIAALTQLAGAAALVLGPEEAWHFDGTLALVENQEVFFHFERLGLNADVVLRYAGILSHRVLRWLASAVMSRCTILHLPDYDPVGLREHAKLAQSCPRPVKLHVPDNLDRLVERFGNPKLLLASADIWPSVRASADPTIGKIARILDHYGRGLEQEALLLPL